MSRTKEYDFKIGDVEIGAGRAAYFIADIAANHDGDIEKAKDLIYACAEMGADAAKFQHFAANSIVSDRGFKDLGAQVSHQASWKKSVYDIYDEAALNNEWTPVLKETCDMAGVAFFTSAYSIPLVNSVDEYVAAYKVGSGDITWYEILGHMARKDKPILLATGASTCDEVCNAMRYIQQFTDEICLMQCNTNYTASGDNFRYIHLNVLKTYEKMFPMVTLGLSDHTPGHSTVLGAIALGAKVIEKHFTLDNALEGPDHKFSMNPKSWKEMVDRARELESALGVGVKKVEDNEKETNVLQRRAIRIASDLPAGTRLSKENLVALRPCPTDGIPPYMESEVLGKALRVDLVAGSHIRMMDLI